MIDFHTMTLLDRLNTVSKPLGKSYALLGNRKSLQLFMSTPDETVEICHSTPKSVYGVLKTLLNAVPNEYANQNNIKEENI